MQSSTNNTAIVRPIQFIVRYININSINGNKISNEHQNRQEIHSTHSSISVTRLNRDKFRSAKTDSTGDHRKNKNSTIFKDKNVIYVTKNPSESSHQKRRKSGDIQNHITVEHINTRQNDVSIADTYTISFRLILIGFGTNTNNAFYADII